MLNSFLKLFLLYGSQNVECETMNKKSAIIIRLKEESRLLFFFFNFFL